MASRRRRRRALRRVRPGDGSALAPYRFWHALHRTQFVLDHRDADGAPHRAVVDVHFFADDLLPASASFDKLGALAEKVGLGGANDADDAADAEDEDASAAPPVALYVDGVQVHRANLPAAFPVPGGVIEVAASPYGLSRMHVVSEDGQERVLQPHPHSLEGLRARFAQRFPGISRVIGVAAVLVLLGGLALFVPQLLELVTRTEVVAQYVGTFTSPIRLPEWANTALLVAGILAALERALTLRNHWLIDADTTWTSWS